MDAESSNMSLGEAGVALPVEQQDLTATAQVEQPAEEAAAASSSSNAVASNGTAADGADQNDAVAEQSAVSGETTADVSGAPDSAMQDDSAEGDAEPVVVSSSEKGNEAAASNDDRSKAEEEHIMQDVQEAQKEEPVSNDVSADALPTPAPQQTTQDHQGGDTAMQSDDIQSHDQDPNLGTFLASQLSALPDQLTSQTNVTEGSAAQGAAGVHDDSAAAPALQSDPAQPTQPLAVPSTSTTSANIDTADLSMSKSLSVDANLSTENQKQQQQEQQQQPEPQQGSAASSTPLSQQKTDQTDPQPSSVPADALSERTYPSYQASAVSSSLLATDPRVALQAANELLARKPQTLSRLARLRQRVEKDPFDGQAWLELISDAVQKGDLERTREVYEGFLKAFPDNAREWIAYADLELSHGNNDRVNAIFGRCLRTSPSVQLWHFYLTYIRRTNPIDRSSPERAAPARDVITKAFEFSLAYVGTDYEAGGIWHDYLEFLKEGEVSGTWEAQQKMDKLRQTYQRAVCIPLNNIEQIWRDYDMFENNLNRATAKRFLQDRSPAYMTARATGRKIMEFMNRIRAPAVPQRPDWDSRSDREQVEIWKQLIAYEDSNPMELEDPAVVRTRVLQIYKKAIASLRFYPEIWYMAAMYARKNDKIDDANAFFRSGMEANNTSLLLHYAYIETEESKGGFEACHKAYSGLIERLQAEIDSLNNATQKDVQDALEEKARVEAEEKALRAQQQQQDDNDTDIVGEDIRIQERENIRKAIIDSKADELEELKRLGANVWIMHMRFARRAEGIQAARSVFSKARKWPHVTWHVFEASAMLELRWNKEVKIATNVFEVGLKRFSEEVGFVMKYLEFLITINDDGNARALFERSIAKVPADKARPLWEKWADHEYLFGDLAAIQKLDARMAEAFPEESAIERFTDRHTYLDLDDLAYRELGKDDHEERGSRREASSPPPEGSVQLQQQQQQQQQPQGTQQAQQQPSQQGMAQGNGPPGQAGMQNGPPQSNMPYPAGGPAPPMMDNFNRGRGLSPQVGFDQNEDRRRSGGKGHYGKRRRSPSPQGRGRLHKRAPSPPRVSRHTPPDDFPEAIPWLLSQLPSKTVFAAHGPILDWQHLLHIITTVNLPPAPQHMPARGRDRSVSPRRRPGGGPRRRSPDYGRRR